MPLEYRWRKKKKSLWWHFKDCGWHYSQSTDRFVFWVQMLRKEQMHLPLQTQCIQSGDRAFSRYWVEGCPGSVVCRFRVQREEYKDEAPWGFGERWLAFDHPSGVSDVAAVKNTGEAAALVCAKHISSKCLACSVAPHLNESFLRLIEHAAGSPVDTEDLDFFSPPVVFSGEETISDQFGDSISPPTLKNTVTCLRTRSDHRTAERTGEGAFLNIKNTIYSNGEF